MGDVPRANLYDTALQWLTEDRAHRRQLELSGRKMRGARRNPVRNLTLMFVVAPLTNYARLFACTAGRTERLRSLL